MNAESETVEASLLANTINIFVSPMEVFAALKVKPTFLFPFLLLVLSSIAAYTWYFYIVDFSWLTDQLLAKMGDLPAEEIDQIRKGFDMIGSTGMMLTRHIGTVVMALVIYSAQAGYLALISATSGDAIRFKQWFSLVSWTYFIGLLSVLVIVVNIILSENGQISLYDINSLSLTGLGVDAGGNSSLQSLFDTLSLTMFWSLALLVVGYQSWTKSGYAKASLIVLLPHVLIYGVWAIVALT